MPPLCLKIIVLTFKKQVPQGNPGAVGVGNGMLILEAQCLHMNEPLLGSLTFNNF